jgi:NitT/TauT family transport system substrate-binding protein
MSQEWWRLSTTLSLSCVLARTRSVLVKRKRTIIGPAILALVAVVIGVGVWSALPSASGQSLTPVTITPDFLPGGNHAFMYAARELGYYKQEGLDVQIVHVGGASAAQQSLIAGKAQFAYTDFATMAVTRQKQNADVQAVMGVQQQTAMAILSPAAKNITKPAHLVGKHIVDFAGSSTQTVWPVFLKINGLTAQQVKMDLVDPSARLSLVVQGKADGAIAFYTDNLPVLKSQCNCDVNALTWKDFGIRLMGSGIVTRAAYATQNPKVVGGFVRASQRGLQYCGTQAQECAEVMARALPNARLNPSLLQQTITMSFQQLARTQANAKDPLGFMEKADWAATTELMEQAGSLKPGYNVEEFYTNQFIPRS